MKKSLYSPEYFQKRDYLDLKIASVVENLVRESGSKTILDVGCGTGKLVRYLNKNGFKAFGCDPNSVNKPSAIFFKSTATRLPFKSNIFDMITCISVIEHLKKGETENFLDEVQRVLKIGGYIFLVTPNYNSIWRMILRKKWFGYSDPTHINFYTPSLLSKLLTENGFQGIKFSFKINKLGFINYLLVSTPFWRIRDSFYVSGQKI